MISPVKEQNIRFRKEKPSQFFSGRLIYIARIQLWVPKQINSKFSEDSNEILRGVFNLWLLK
jgi:hypothetical protein